jgi:release factor glutamine methyltransferase
MRDATALGVDRLDSQLLIAHAIHRPRSWLIAHDDSLLEESASLWLRDSFARLAAGEPLAYVIGEKEFRGLVLQVDTNVLVPREDTAVLVDWAIELLGGELSLVERPNVIDLGTGSGAIALTVKHSHPGAKVVATDLSPLALEVARINTARLGLDVLLLQGAWWEALDARRFHLALANPPYIAEGDPHLPALRHEPGIALTSGSDGLGALREIVRGAPEHLETGGWLLLEHGHDQHERVQFLLRSQGFSDVSTRRDLAGHARCTGGRR